MMPAGEIQTKIRDKARELLTSGATDCVIGFERASDGKTARPAFIYDAEGVDRLVYDETCVHNLAKYLLNRKDKVTGIVAKPCDSRTINLLINEKQVQRDKVYIIGAVCEGMRDDSWNSVGEKLQDKCLRCAQRTPVVYDFLIGQPIEAGRIAYDDVESMDSMPPAEKRAFWLEQFGKCIRCHA
ncbi:MAG: hypothetical protein HYX90_05185, partial [Chloroflexi bacterium]|nr:hypothetical protein [Chloroflexota bacterium]